jgi:hypothetical protein
LDNVTRLTMPISRPEKTFFEGTAHLFFVSPVQGVIAADFDVSWIQSHG